MPVLYQLYVVGLIGFGSAMFMIGINLERRRIWALEARKNRARLTMPERICGAWVFNDGSGRSHHCTLGHDHNGDVHRSSTGMGRKVAA